MATSNLNFKVKNGLDAAEDVTAGRNLRSTNSSGDEGGEIFLNKAVTNTTLTGGVTIDVFQDKLRFFEQGGSARGFYIDIASGGGGVSTNLVGGGGGGGTTTNSLVLKADSGTTEGTDLYTFNGSAAKTLNLVAGSGISITKTSGQWSLAVSGNPSVPTDSTSADGFGYVGMPQVLNPTSPYTISASDAGKHIYMTTTGRTITIPANSSVPLEIGTTITIINAAAVTTTISINTDTLIIAYTGLTGSRTLQPYGVATLIKITATSWMISGNGVN